jgi:hypothetical protein
MRTPPARSPRLRLPLKRRDSAIITVSLLTLFTCETIFAESLSDQKSPVVVPSTQSAHPVAAQSTGTKILPGKVPGKKALEEWRNTIIHTPTPKKGCFKASFPNAQWQEIPCVEPPHILFLPSADAGSPRFNLGGDNGDISTKLTSGHIAAAHGIFEAVSGVTSASNQAYTLQLNTGTLATTACSASTLPTCFGVEQFVYHSGTGTGAGTLNSQYWVGNFGPAGTACPSPQGTDCGLHPVSTTGWCPAPGFSTTYCVVNGLSPTVPGEALTSLGNLHLSGLSGPNVDEAILVDGNDAYVATGANYFSDLSSAWSLAEFNVFGWGESAQVQFEPGVALRGRITVESPNIDSLTCDSRGVTNETNNLNQLGAMVAPPSVVFMESNGAGSPFAAPAEAISPADGAKQVPPWPTHLVWPAWPNETAWTVDVDTDSTFHSPNHRVIPSTALDPATHSASADANLLAGKTYYWRASSNVDHECPRFVHTFSTEPQQPTALTPSHQTPNVYPWQLEFQWQAPDGSESFDWKLTDQHHGNDSYTLTQHVDLGACSLPSCKVVRDVAVNSVVNWSVVAHGPTDLYQVNDGSIAAAEMVHTITPQPTITNSKRGEQLSVNPWDVEVDWQKLQGAAGYELHVRDGLLGPESPLKTYDASATHGVDATIAHFDEENTLISVKLYPIGPKISPQIGSEFQDRGDYDGRAFFNAGTQTIPCVNKPFTTCESNPSPSNGHVAYGSPVEFGWQYVKNATSYVMNWYPMTTSWDPTLPQPLFAYSNVNFSAPLGGYTKTPDGVGTDVIVIPGEAFTPSLGSQTYGTWISVRAKGPSELDGFQSEYQLSPLRHTSGGAYPYLDPGFEHQNGDGPAYIDIPDIVVDDLSLHMQVDSSGRVLLPVTDAGATQLTFGFGQSPVIYGPQIVQYALFGQHDCSAGGQPLPGAMKQFQSPVQSAHWWETYSLDQSILAYDRDFSFLVAAPSLDPNVAPKGQCINFHSAPSFCGNGVREGTEQCDEGQDNGKPESSCSGVCTRNQLVCGQPKYNTGGSDGFKGTISLGHANASAVLFYNTLVIPDNVIVYVGGQEVWRSGCASTQGWLQQSIFGDNTPLGNATIEVMTNCGDVNQNETQWAFEVHCENDPTSTGPAPWEPKH